MGYYAQREDAVTVRELIAELELLPEGAKDFPAVMMSRVWIPIGKWGRRNNMGSEEQSLVEVGSAEVFEDCYYRGKDWEDDDGYEMRKNLSQGPAVRIWES